jgi:hypothetical protein
VAVPYAVHIERHGGPASSVRALVDTDTGMEMLGIAEKHLLDNKVEVTTYFINDENMKNCPHIDIKIGNGNVKVVIDTGSEISWITEDLYAYLLSQGLEMLELKLQSTVLVTSFGSRSQRIKK